MSPRSVSKSLVAAGLIAAGALKSARAEEGVALSVPLTPVGDRSLLVHSPEVRGHGTLRAALLFDYATEPLVITTPKQEQDAVVSRQAWLVARSSFAISHRYLVALDLPLSVYAAADRPVEATPGAPSPSSFGAGDLSLTGRMTVLGRPGDAAMLGASATLFAPTGSHSAYATDGAFRARLVASAGGSTERFYWAVDGGVHLRPSHQFEGVVPHRTGSSVVAGVAAGYVVDAPGKFTVGPEASLTSAFAGDASLLDPRSSGLLVMLGARYRPVDAWVVGVSAGPSVGQGAGSADFRSMAFVAFSPEKEPPPPDRDADRVPDAVDACPELAGVSSNDPVMHGCPELPRDADGDAVPDSFDACPNEAGIPTGNRRTHGCPPSVDKADAIPRAEVEHEKIAISEQVQFETGTAVLRADSDPVLSDVAGILKAHPEIERVQIQGHTDDTGSDEYNRELSQRRAESVLRWLTEHGVDEKRLEARGMGRSRPIADNATDEGRARNRRVEFLIVKSASNAEGHRR